MESRFNGSVGVKMVFGEMGICAAGPCDHTPTTANCSKEMEIFIARYYCTKRDKKERRSQEYHPLLLDA